MGVGLILRSPSFPVGIEGWMLDVIVLIPDHCLSIYFERFKALINNLFQKHVNYHQKNKKEEGQKGRRNAKPLACLRTVGNAISYGWPITLFYT